MAQKNALGLHTKEERQHAYTIAHRAYRKAMRAMQHGPGVPEFNYALGCIEAIGDLALVEAPDDKELLGLLGDMQSELYRTHTVPTR